MIRNRLNRTSKEKYFFDMTKTRRKCQIYVFQCIKYRVSSVKVRLRRSFHFVSFYCYLELLRTNVSVAVVEYIKLFTVCSLLCLYFFANFSLFLNALDICTLYICYVFERRTLCTNE